MWIVVTTSNRKFILTAYFHFNRQKEWNENAFSNMQVAEGSYGVAVWEKNRKKSAANASSRYHRVHHRALHTAHDNLCLPLNK